MVLHGALGDGLLLDLHRFTTFKAIKNNVWW